MNPKAKKQKKFTRIWALLKNRAYVHAQPCPTLCDPVDSSPPGSSVHGLLQARTLEWVAMPSCRGSSRRRDGTCPVSLALSGGFLPPSRLGSLKPEALRPLMIKMHTTSEKDGVSSWSSDWDSDLPMWRVQV